MKEKSQDIQKFELEFIKVLENKINDLINELRFIQELEIKNFRIKIPQTQCFIISQETPFLFKNYGQKYPYNLNIDTNYFQVNYDEDIFENTIKEIKEKIRQARYEQYDIEKRLKMRAR